MDQTGPQTVNGMTNWWGDDVDSLPGHELRRPWDPDFTMLAGEVETVVAEDSPQVRALQSHLTSRRARARDDMVTLPGWSANIDDPFLRVFLDWTVRDDITDVRLYLRVTPPTLDTPVTYHELETHLPLRVFADLGFDRVACGLWFVALLERLAQAYAHWQGWDPPEPLPRTRAEREWMDEHGAPPDPGAVVDLTVTNPPPERTGRPWLWDVLAGLTARKPLERGAEFSEHLSSVSRQRAFELVGAWTYLLYGMGTESHLRAAEQVTGGALHEDDFADLRSWVILAADEPGRSDDVEYFTQVLEGLDDEEDLDECCVLLGRMMDRVSGDMTADLEFPDPWQIRAD